jgi:hypothetical protein
MWFACGPRESSQAVAALLLHVSYSVAVDDAIVCVDIDRLLYVFFVQNSMFSPAFRF